MTAANDFDRVLEAWFRADAPALAPSDLVDAIAAETARTRRRPGWLTPDRWLPRPSQSMTVLRYAAVAALVLLIAITAILAIGSRPRVPPPFGPARPGIFVLNLYGDIVSMAPDGTRQHALTSGVDWDSNPVFSRDGTRVAFWSTGILQALSDLVVMNADGSGRHAVARAELAEVGASTHHDGSLAWSPDGQSIAYWADTASQSQMFVARADGAGVTQLGDPALMAQLPAWSPDGSLIAFSGGASDQSRGLYVMRADGSGARRISTVSGNAGAFAPVWSPDGRRLMFSGGDGSTTVWMVDVDGANEHLVDRGAFVGSQSWSPDGKRIAWLHASADSSLPPEVDVADADGSNVRRYAHEGVPRMAIDYDGNAPAVGWSADGRYVIGILTVPNGDANRLIEIDAETGAETVIAVPGLRAWTQQRLAP